MKPYIDLTGFRSHRWLVVGGPIFRQLPSGQRQVKWFCRCDCGVEREIVSQSLRTGASKSCGCLKKELASVRGTVHNLSKTPVYRVWKSMLNRCENPDNAAYKHYGGRGIAVCDRWHNLDSFIEDMGHPPDGLTLDRIDVDLGYFKENCRWVDMTVQIVNRRTSGRNTSGATGVSFHQGKWVAKIGYYGKQVYLGRFSTFEDACIARACAEHRYFGQVRTAQIR